MPGWLNQRRADAEDRAQITIAALMFVLSAMSYFDRTIMSIVAPVIIREFGISETQMGAVFSAFIISYALLQTPGGRLADRFGPRRVLAVAGLGTAVFTGVTAAAGKPGLGSWIGVIPAFLIIRLAFGAFTAPLYPACGKTVAAWYPAGAHARLQALIITGAPIGSAASPVLFASLMGFLGWRLSFWVVAAATAVPVLLWYFLVRDRPPSGGEGVARGVPKARWRELLADRNLLLLTAGYFCLGCFEYIFFYWIYYYFGVIRGLGPAQSAVYVTILFLSMAAMLPIGGWASDRLVARYGQKTGRRAVPIVGMSLSAVLLYVGVGGVGTRSAVALLSLALGLAASSEGAFWGSAIDIGDTRVGAVSGVLNTGGNLGGILGPVVTPFLAERFGWEWGLYFGGFVVLAGMLVWFFIDPTRKIVASRRPAG